MARDGTLKISVLGDISNFSKGMQDAGKGLDTLGGKIKLVGAVAGGIAAGGFAVMTKGALEMEAAQGRFQAATGASRDEAVKFTQSMNGLVGNNATVGKSFDQIAAAGTQVAQQFKLTGQDAANLTQDFLAFSKVTGQDAAGAVDDFDAALDAFGLPAARATGLMDQLIASNQKYGTEAGPAAVKAITDMAPALQAMGMSLDDGIGLLNLFESAGLDAAAAPKALNKAVQELKPGQTLDDLITQIGKIEDPLLRAQAAAELFGVKSGSGLAQAIKPGMTSLDEFKISVGEAADKTDTAAADMVTTADKFKMGFERIGSALRGLGQDFGPLVTGVGAIASGLGPMLGTVWTAVAKTGAWKAAAGAAGAAASVAYQAGMKIASAIGSALDAGWTIVKGVGKAAIELAGGIAGVAYSVGMKIGKKLSDAVFTGWGLVTNAVKGAATASGGSGGVAYSIGVKIGKPIIDAVSGLWALVAKSPVGLAAAKAAGLAAGAAYAIGFLGAIALVPLLQEAANQAHDALFGAFNARDPITEWMNKNRPGAVVAGEQTGTEIGTSTSGAFWDYIRGAKLGPPLPPGWGVEEGRESGTEVAQTWNSAFLAEYEQGNKDLAASRAIARALEQQMKEAHKIAAWGGAQTPREFSQGAISAFDTVTDAFDRLKQLMKDTLSPAKQIAELEGIATSRRLAKGLRDGRPEVRGEAQQLALDTLAELHKLAPGSKAIGTLTTKLLANALPNERPALEDAIAAIVGVVKRPLNSLPEIAADAGHDTVRAFTRAVRSDYPEVRSAMDGLGRIVTNRLQLDSPAKEGPWSLNGGPMAIAARAARKITGSLASGVRGGMADVQAAFAGLPGIGATGFAALAPAFSGGPVGGGSSGGDHYHFHFHDLALLDEGGVDRLEQRFEQRRRLRTRGGARPLGG